MGVAGIIQLITILEPQIVNVVMMLKDKTTGQMSVIAVLDAADAQIAANQQAIATWVASHPAATSTGTSSAGTGTPAA